MHSLRVLAQIIESRKSARAVALEGTFARMFSANLLAMISHIQLLLLLPDMTSKVFTSSEAQVAWRIFCTKEALRFALLL